MDTPHNTLDFVLVFMRRLAHAQIATWLFGGWAEEALRLYRQQHHRVAEAYETYVRALGKL